MANQSLTFIEGFNVRIVRQGERYGRNDCLVHDDEKPLVEFFDSKQNLSVFGPYGQFVSRYYCETILAGDYPQGLCLDGGVPAWSISTKGMRSVIQFLQVSLSA